MRDALGSVQSALVLGGGSEIALATVRALVAERTRTVILAARQPATITEVDELRAAGATVEVVPFDADDIESHPSLIDDVFGRYGDIDLVLLAFGVLGSGAEQGPDPDAALGVIRTNFLGAVSAALPVAQRLKAQGHGSLAVMSSVAAERPRKSNFVYGSSKAGLDAFAQGLSDSLAGTGVHVMVVRPGFVATKMTASLRPPPFATTPDEVARVIVGGLRRQAHTVWAPPVMRYVMWVLRQLPRSLFRRLPI